ncbi:MAG TPA: GatB/YqeY domain-containing protein [Thiobacillaceae bacterium]|nr:GatB/YqeY domain-containing protein [Thiobacillaceae bacterium]
MSLKARITDDMKAAMRARETARLGTIRLLLAAIKQKEVDARAELDDAAIGTVVEKLIKQRRDSISQFQAAGRDDLVAAEQAELAVLETYLPEQLSPGEVEAAVAAAIAETGAASPKDMGKVMALLRPRLAGRADMAQVSATIKAHLAG